MDAAESPLDVLTRAATMVQNNILPPSYEEARLCREEVSNTGGKWRRQRQNRCHPLSTNYTSREPIDLSTRRIRGSPPSYMQTMQAKKAASALNKNDSGGVCDPMIDEHFRRSLGKDYLSNSSSSDDKDSSSEKLDDSTSLSVDDHFAKALGDTWVKLQEEMEKESSARNAEKENKSDASSDDSDKDSNPESLLRHNPKTVTSVKE